MPRSTAHGVAGVLEVVPLLMSALGAHHAVDDHAVMHLLRHGGQTIAKLHAIGTVGMHFVSPMVSAPGTTPKVSRCVMPPEHEQIDDVARRRHLLGLRAAFKRNGTSLATQHGQHRDTEAGLGDAEAKSRREGSSAERRAEFMMVCSYWKGVTFDSLTLGLLDEEKLTTRKQRVGDVWQRFVATFADDAVEHGAFVVGGAATEQGFCRGASLFVRAFRLWRAADSGEKAGW